VVSCLLQGLKFEGIPTFNHSAPAVVQLATETALFWWLAFGATAVHTYRYG